MNSKKDWAVFVSAGDRNSLDQWVRSDPDRRWDLIVAYYGDDLKKYEQVQLSADICYLNKGSKFQNLKRLFINQPGLLKQYKYIFVCDDDLIFENHGINHSFEAAERFEFWITQPSFSSAGKISHPITRNVPDSDIRLVNFIEVTCPLFRADKLFDFLNVYDGELVGLGIDWWFCNYFINEKSCKFAILDFVQVLNPNDASKEYGFREIDKLQPTEQRVKEWYKSKKSFGYKEYNQKTFSKIVFFNKKY